MPKLVRGIFIEFDSSGNATSLIDLQKGLCRRIGADFLPSDELLKVGISRDFDPARFPINGLRHPPEGDMTGWYIWSGEEFSEAPDFFVPRHTKHIHDRYPHRAVGLGLAPGWRFLRAPDDEDFWVDANLLDVSSRGPSYAPRLLLRCDRSQIFPEQKLRERAGRPSRYSAIIARHERSQ